MRSKLINLLFHLLGNTYSRNKDIPYLFGATTRNHEQRKKRWDRALYRLYNDKDMLDFLFYQSENDKENAWKGKIDRKIAQGARIRTLFIVYSARRAFEETLKNKRSSADEKSDTQNEIKNIKDTYDRAVDIGA